MLFLSSNNGVLSVVCSPWMSGNFFFSFLVSSENDTWCQNNSFSVNIFFHLFFVLLSVVQSIHAVLVFQVFFFFSWQMFLVRLLVIAWRTWSGKSYSFFISFRRSYYPIIIFIYWWLQVNLIIFFFYFGVFGMDSVSFLSTESVAGRITASTSFVRPNILSLLFKLLFDRVRKLTCLISGSTGKLTNILTAIMW